MIINESVNTALKVDDNYGATTGKWEVSFFGCFTHCVSNCCMVSLLPCVSLAQISARLGLYKFSYVLLSTLIMSGTVSGVSTGLGLVNDTKRVSSVYSGVFGLIVLVFRCSTVLYCALIWKFRSETCTRFQIPGNAFKDCFVSCILPCCTIAQIATHVKSYNPGSCDFGPLDTLPPYK